MGRVNHGRRRLLQEIFRRRGAIKSDPPLFISASLMTLNWIGRRRGMSLKLRDILEGRDLTKLSNLVLLDEFREHSVYQKKNVALFS